MAEIVLPAELVHQAQNIRKNRAPYDIGDMAESRVVVPNVWIDPLQKVCDWAKVVGRVAALHVETDITFKQTQYDARLAVPKILKVMGFGKDRQQAPSIAGEGWKLRTKDKAASNPDSSRSAPHPSTYEYHPYTFGLALSKGGNLITFEGEGSGYTIDIANEYTYIGIDGRKSISGLTIIKPDLPLPQSPAAPTVKDIEMSLAEFIEAHELDLIGSAPAIESTMPAKSAYVPRHSN